MKTSEKLKEAFQAFLPHINGHKTAQELFLQAVNEVEHLETFKEELDKLGAVGNPIQKEKTVANCHGIVIDDNFQMFGSQPVPLKVSENQNKTILSFD